jgi:hypothetical protein
MGPQGGVRGGVRGGSQGARFLLPRYPRVSTTQDPCQSEWGQAPLPMVCERRGGHPTVIGKTRHVTHKEADAPHTPSGLSRFFVFSFFLGLRRERRRAAVHSARDPQSTPPDSKSVHTSAPCDIFYALVAGVRALRRQCQHITTVMHTSMK